MILPKAYLQDYNYRIVGFVSNVAVNLSFTAKFETTKPLKTLKFSGV